MADGTLKHQTVKGALEVGSQLSHIYLKVTALGEEGEREWETRYIVLVGSSTLTQEST